jgi:hypothetical protein
MSDELPTSYERLDSLEFDFKPHVPPRRGTIEITLTPNAKFVGREGWVVSPFKSVSWGNEVVFKSVIFSLRGPDIEQEIAEHLAQNPDYSDYRVTENPLPAYYRRLLADDLFGKTSS